MQNVPTAGLRSCVLEFSSSRLPETVLLASSFASTLFAGLTVGGVCASFGIGAKLGLSATLLPCVSGALLGVAGGVGLLCASISFVKSFQAYQRLSDEEKNSEDGQVLKRRILLIAGAAAISLLAVSAGILLIAIDLSLAWSGISSTTLAVACTFLLLSIPYFLLRHRARKEKTSIESNPAFRKSTSQEITSANSNEDPRAIPSEFYDPTNGYLAINKESYKEFFVQANASGVLLPTLLLRISRELQEEALLTFYQKLFSAADDLSEPLREKTLQSLLTFVWHSASVKGKFETPLFPTLAALVFSGPSPTPLPSSDPDPTLPECQVHQIIQLFNHLKETLSDDKWKTSVNQTVLRENKGMLLEREKVPDEPGNHSSYAKCKGSELFRMISENISTIASTFNSTETFSCEALLQLLATIEMPNIPSSNRDTEKMTPMVMIALAENDHADPLILFLGSLDTDLLPYSIAESRQLMMLHLISRELLHSEQEMA